MLTTRVTQQFPLAADALWAHIGDFGDTGRWSGRPPEACVQSGSGVGALRTLILDDGREIVDRLEAEGEYSYSYSIVSAPLPYTYYLATMAVTPVDKNSCEFAWSSEFTVPTMSDEKAIEFTRNIYRMGIAMMLDSLADIAPATT
ncbi:MAG: SRPBCC family protein [Pseudomonadota bacterium]